ncbi:MAG: MMPL family transporter [Acidobacteriota bacterium]
MKGRVLRALPRALVMLGHRAPVAVLVVVGAAVALGGWLGSRLAFDTDVLNLMPRHDPVVQNFRRILDEFGSLETVLVAVPIKDEEHLDAALSLVDALSDELSQSPDVSHVQAHLEDPVRLAEAVLRHAVLFLDAPGLRALGQRLTPEGLDARAADIRAALDAPHGMLAKEFAIRDPLGLLPLLLGRVSSTPTTLKVDYASGYLLSADHSFVLLLAKPVGPAQDIDFDQKLFADLRERVSRARASVAQEMDLDLADVPDVLLGGGHRIALEDATLIRRDIIVNSLGSVVGVMILFFLAYRRFATVHYAFLPLAAGLALTFGFASLTVGKLSSATAGFAALLVGLGIDFTIVMYGRYLEERGHGLDIGPALENMSVSAGPAVLLGMITTVGTFYGFLVTRFVGLREFGFLTGTGIVLMALCAFLLLPALVTVFDRGRQRPTRSRLVNPAPMLRWAARNRSKVAIAAGLLSVAALAVLPKLQFDDDVRNLRSPSNRGVEIQERVTAAFGLSFNSMMIRVEAASVDDALDKLRVLDGGLDRLETARVVSSYQSLAKLLPPPEAQERALTWIRDHRDLTDPASVTRLFDAALRREGLVPEAMAGGLASLSETLRPTGPVTLDVWKGTPVEEVIRRSLHVGPTGVSTVITVFPRGNAWRREAPPELIELVGTVPGASLTGVNLVSQRLRAIVWRDAGRAGVLGLVLVVAVLLVQMRGRLIGLLCLVPVALGVIWTLGLMAVLGLHLNLLNVFVITMIIGVGSDYGIYILQRSEEGADLDQLAETARAVMLAMLTTIVGFGSLVATHYPGLQSIGWMTGLGVLFSCATAIMILPLLVRHRGGE